MRQLAGLAAAAARLLLLPAGPPAPCGYSALPAGTPLANPPPIGLRIFPEPGAVPRPA